MVNRRNAWAASALLFILLVGCVTLDEAVIRTATLEKVPDTACVERVIQTTVRPATPIKRSHTDWKNESSGRLTHSVDVLSFALDDSAMPPMVISLADWQSPTARTIGGGWSYRFNWNFDRRSKHRQTDVITLAQNLEREIAAQCGIAPFADKVRNSEGHYHTLPPLV